MKSLSIGFLFTLLCSCASVSVHKYEEFGPPVLANDLIGMDWWQWQNHGASRPTKNEIKVIVYRNIDLSKVKNKFPVSPKNEKDYRYVEYKNAIDYLDIAISENVIEGLTQQLIKTRKKIQATLNDGDK